MKQTSLSGDQLKALRAVPVSAASPNRLRVALAMLDLTQNDVARATALTQATVSDICNFRVLDVKYTTLRALADFFGCAIDDLFPRLSEAASSDQPALPGFRKTAVAR